MLTTQGYDVWWDTGLLAGNDFQHTIPEKLDEAKCVIVVWTEHSVESIWVRAEASRALNRKVLVPLQLRAADLPMPFGMVHAENFQEWAGNAEDKEFQRLLRAVGQYVVTDEAEPVEQTGFERTVSAPTKPIEKPKAQAAAQPGKQAKPIAETAAVKPVANRNLKQQRATGGSGNFLQRFGGKAWTAVSAVLVFGLVYAVNNTDEIWGWFQGGKVEVAAVEQVSQTDVLQTRELPEKVGVAAVEQVSQTKVSQTQEPPKLLKADKTKIAVAVAEPSVVIAEPEQMGKLIELGQDLKLVKVPRGSFQMGSEQGISDEQPVHKVNIVDDFWMSETEVTFAQYDAYAEAVGKAKPNDRGWGRGSRPVINVSWDDAKDFAQWLSSNNDQGLSCRLPSEAEWEYAGRAGTTTAYPWGDKAGRHFANYGKDDCCAGLVEGKDKWLHTAPTKQFPANKYGLHDMHGNVWEWVQDRWHDNYQGAPTDGSAWEAGESNLRVLRGGSWVFPAHNMRSAFRYNHAPESRNDLIGFRVACSL